MGQSKKGGSLISAYNFGALPLSQEVLTSVRGIIDWFHKIAQPPSEMGMVLERLKAILSFGQIFVASILSNQLEC